MEKLICKKFLFILFFIYILILSGCQVDISNNYYEKQKLISSISDIVKSMEYRENIIYSLKDELNKIAKTDSEYNSIEDTIEFIENPEPLLIEIAENEDGCDQLTFINVLLKNDIQNIEVAMKNVSEDMLRMYQQSIQGFDLKLFKSKYNCILRIIKSINDINDSDVTYSSIMAGIATAAAVTSKIGEAIPALAFLIPIGNTAFLSTSLTFLGIFAIKPELGKWTINFIYEAIKSNCFLDADELHAYMLNKFCSNENSLVRYEKFVGVWYTPLSIYFAIPILKWIYDKFLKTTENFTGNIVTIDGSKFIKVMKIIKSKINLNTEYEQNIERN